MQYLLDTCVISDFIKGEPGTQTRFQQTLLTEIALSSITVMELRYGLALNPQRAHKIEPVILGLIASVSVLPFTSAEAGQASHIRALLKSDRKSVV